MAIFTVSDNAINILKKKKLRTIIIPVIITMIIMGGLYSMVIVPKTGILGFIIFFSFTTVMISLVMYFSLKNSLKLLENEMKSIQYIIENERLIIKKNDFEQYNISKDDIQCINRYKNNVILIILNTKRKITVEKYLDNFDQLIENLNDLTQVNNINGNPNIF
jgi:hypothetical protein